MTFLRQVRKKMIPIIAMVTFIIIMTTGSVLKHSFHDQDRVMYHVEQLYDAIEAQNWSSAYTRLTQIKQAWKHVVYRIQFSVERDEINNFKKHLERMRGFIIAQEQPGALSELTEMIFVFQELGR